MISWRDLLQPLTEIVGNGGHKLPLPHNRIPRFLSINMTFLTEPYKLGNYGPVVMAQGG